LVEAEENCPEVGFRAFSGVWLKLRLNVDDEGGANRGEQTGLGTWSTLCSERGTAETHENQGGVEIFIVLLHVFGIVLHGLSFVHTLGTRAQIPTEHIVNTLRA